MEAFPHVFQVSAYTLREGFRFDMKGKWNERFFKNNNPIVLELGCGKGEYTVGLAQLFPDKNFVGVDIERRPFVDRSKGFARERATKRCFSTD